MLQLVAQLHFCRTFPTDPLYEEDRFYAQTACKNMKNIEVGLLDCHKHYVLVRFVHLKHLHQLKAQSHFYWTLPTDPLLWKRYVLHINLFVHFKYWDQLNAQQHYCQTFLTDSLLWWRHVFLHRHRHWCNFLIFWFFFFCCFFGVLEKLQPFLASVSFLVSSRLNM